MKKTLLTIVTLSLLSSTAFAETKPKVPKNVESKIFKAADFKKTKYGWEGNCDTGQITIYKDLNGDGLKDAVISVQSPVCYGRTGFGYYIVTQQKDASWKMIFSNSGAPKFIETKGKDGWPDIENQGAGFCFAVYRWNGKEYEINRYEYEGKTCSIR
jgi:hypothetical protein